jgi:TPP-dependent pyruvate/acetoin dehydrogenase alpha subunit
MSLQVPHQILREDGSLVDPALLPPLSDEALRDLYRWMVRLRQTDERMLTLQRQGRISFYGAATGQEAAVIGSASAMDPRDFVLPALREAGVLLYRGFPLQDYIDQLYGNDRDLAKGRQMPCHPSGGRFRYITMSSCIGNQIPQVAGVAYGSKLMGTGEVTFGYMGEGATSQGDFHVGMNFAGVFHVPAVFICQNNQWSISVPWERQSAERSVAKKASAYGFEGVAVDGNDVLAVHTAVKAAADKARRGEGPTLLELLTYRVGAHTTSDDPSRYRDESVTQVWKTQRDPIQRMRVFLTQRGLWDDTRDADLIKSVAEEIKTAVTSAEAAPLPGKASLFDDVFETLPPHLREQRGA